MLLTWGRGPRHGHETDADLDVPRALAALPSIRQVACGELHSLALTADGRVLSWGSGLMGALGGGGFGARWAPTEIAALRAVGPVVDLAAGRHHSLALTHAGEASASASPSPSLSRTHLAHAHTHTLPHSPPTGAHALRRGLRLGHVRRRRRV